MLPLRTAAWAPLILLGLVTAAAAAGRAPAAGTAADLGACAAAVARAEARYGLPPGLMLVIAKVESGRPANGGVQPWPWTIDADGQGLFFATEAQALAWARGATGVGSMDVGCMQVNLRAHPAAFRDLDEAFDPDANADYAARFLLRLREDAGGNWFTAVGWYHSRTPGLAADYRERVSAVAAGRTPAIGPDSLYARAARTGGLRLALAGGGTLTLNVHRQPSARTRRVMGHCQVAAVLRGYLRSAPVGCGR